MNVIAEDKGSPPLQTNISVTIIILRNSGNLKFDVPSYRVKINENYQLIKTILTVVAQPSVSNVFS